LTDRRRLAGYAALAGLIVIAVGSVACQAALGSPPAADRSTPIDASASCAPTDLGRTTAVPAEPGPTSLGADAVPYGDLPRGRYAGDAWVHIDAPCWRRLPDPAPGTLLLARTDVPDDRVALRIGYRAMVDPCRAGALVDATPDAIEAWIRSADHVEVGAATSTTIGHVEARVLELRATTSGSCDVPRPGFEAGDDALFGLPLLTSWQVGQAGRVAIVDGPVEGAIALVVVSSSDADALAAFRAIADPLVASIDFITAVP